MNAPAQCNAPDICGPLVEIIAAAPPSPPPVPVGGMIADGTYELTAVTLYTNQMAPGPIGQSFAETLVLSAGNYEVTYLQLGQSTGGSGTVVVQGTQIQVDSLCPQVGMNQSASFSVIGSDLHFFLAGQGSSTESVFTKLP